MSKRVIFICGWAYRPSIWHKQRCFAEEYECCFVDLEEICLKQLSTKDCFDFKSALGKMLVGDSVVVAWSMGAILMLEFLGELSKKLKGAVLVSATARFTQDESYAGIPRVLVKRMMKNLKLNLNKTLSQFYRLAFTDEEIKAGYLDELTALQSKWKSFDRFFLHSALEYLLNVDLRSQLSTLNIDIPVLLVHGIHDEICPVFGCEFLEKNLNAMSISTAKINAGHIPFFTKSNEFNDILHKFLRNLR
ncbi:alpha/beta hydrolase [Peptococcaceae bacterium]|nr:alpha/beta hydrolase [Peptococcaceae bacterium]